MDFFERQDVARGKTRLLVVYFALAVILTVVAVNAVMLLAFMQGGVFKAGLDEWFGRPIWMLVTLGTLLVIGFGSALRLAQLSGGGSAVAEMAGGRKVDPATSGPEERKLVNVVEEMSIASGVPVPDMYVLDGERGINAFAAGHRPTEAAVAVTKGALETLDRDELQGVIGHEFSHILNGDMRINVRLIGILAGIIIISQIGYFMMRTGARRSYSYSRSRKGGNPLPMIGFGLYVVGYIGLFFGRLIKAAISRQREYLADASSVQFTRNPGGIAHALWKIKEQGSRLDGSHAEEMSHMCFGETVKFHLAGLFATHPPIDERIKIASPSVFNEMTMAGREGKKRMEAPEPAGPARPTSRAVSAVSGMAAMAIAANTAGLSSSVGNPKKEHFEYAEKLHGAVPAQLMEALHNPEEARYAVYALLMGEDGRAVGGAAAYLTRVEGAKAASQAGMVAELLSPLGPGARLPLLDLAMPALRRMKPEGAARFIETANGIVMLDKEVSLFEFALMTILKARLMPARKGADRVRYKSIWGVEAEARALISSLAHAGKGDTGSAYSKALGVLGLRPGDGPMKPGSAAELLEASLEKLSEMSPQLKKKLVTACAECVLHDGVVEVAEGEILRAVSARLDCPMPPIIKGGAG